MFRSDLTGQPAMFAFTVRDLVANDSDVWLYMDLFDQLDLEDFDADYVSQGQRGIEPKLILRAMFYGLTHGIASGRKLGEVCSNDARYLVLSGEQRPTGRTFQRFMIRHSARLEGLFVQVVKLAQTMGLAKLGKVALDGSRFQANTSKHKAMSKGRMDLAIEQIHEELTKLKADLARSNAVEEGVNDDSLPNEIKLREERLAKIKAAKEALEREYEHSDVPEKAQKSFADTEAMPMSKKGSDFQYGYNCQAAVDEDSQIVVAADLHDAPNDYQALPKMLDQIEENCGTNADSVLADAGYRSAENLADIESHGSTPFIASAKGENAAAPDVRRAIDLSFDESGETTACCPSGVTMSVRTRHPDGGIDVRIPRRACGKCEMRNNCPLQSLKQKSIYLPKPEYVSAVLRNHERMRTADGRAIYRRRKVIVEPVFGNIKNKGIRILVRGKKKVRTWWQVACTAHNIEKIVASMAKNAVFLGGQPAMRSPHKGNSPIFGRKTFPATPLDRFLSLFLRSSPALSI